MTTGRLRIVNLDRSVSDSVLTCQHSFGRDLTGYSLVQNHKPRWFIKEMELKLEGTEEELLLLTDC
jgi:hypothetical protein